MEDGSWKLEGGCWVLAQIVMESFSLKNAIFCCAKKATKGSSF
jgi:hypothetical protein